jgi:hypothetical protein
MENFWGIIGVIVIVGGIIVTIRESIKKRTHQKIYAKLDKVLDKNENNVLEQYNDKLKQLIEPYGNIHMADTIFREGKHEGWNNFLKMAEENQKYKVVWKSEDYLIVSDKMDFTVPGISGNQYGVIKLFEQIITGEVEDDFIFECHKKRPFKHYNYNDFQDLKGFKIMGYTIMEK